MSEIPKNSVVSNTSGAGYIASREKRKENIYNDESHIIPNQNALTAMGAETYEIGNAFPKVI